MASSLTTQAIMFIFLISTVYGLAYYWAEGSGELIGIEGIADTEGSLVVGISADNSITSLVFGVIDIILEFVSWLSLFALVKGMFYALLPDFLYTAFNLFLLRPTGWISALITTEWVINKVRGSSEN